MEVKIQIPDNCELIKDGNTYIVKEKKDKPRSWEEFCKNYPRTKDEYFIRENSSIDQVYKTSNPRNARYDKNICISREEAEAFLALMQLRQLRKAWIGDWKPNPYDTTYGIFVTNTNIVQTGYYNNIRRSLTFPTKEMAEDFLYCFKDLCETAKVLL